MSDTWALVPLKSLQGGKERLATMLSPEQRAELIVAMLEDVIEALRAVPFAGDRILLVTEDAAAGNIARLHGIGVYCPTPAATDPLNAALNEAAAHVARSGGDTVLIVHADVPCATAADFRAVLAEHAERTGPRATLVSDRAGEGTNCLVVSPPDRIAFRFGARSRARHVAACETAGIPCRESDCAGLAADVDYPEDIAALRRAVAAGDCGQRTRAVLERWEG